MGLGIMIIGESGSGKSSSLRNFAKDELSLVNVNGKMLPFRGTFEHTLRSDQYDEITRFIKSAPTKAIAVDDCQYLLANEFMRRCRETGYNKFTEMGEKFWNLIRLVDTLPDDVVVYFIGHTQTDETGRVRFKTIGKLLDEKITVEGMFTVVLHAVAMDGQYLFATQSRGDTAKSPMGLFDEYLIPNDLKAVDSAIRAYYDFPHDKHICADCGNEIVPKPGSTLEALITQSTERFGRKLCPECARRVYNAASTVSG